MKKIKNSMIFRIILFILTFLLIVFISLLLFIGVSLYLYKFGFPSWLTALLPDHPKATQDQMTFFYTHEQVIFPYLLPFAGITTLLTYRRLFSKNQLNSSNPAQASTPPPATNPPNPSSSNPPPPPPTGNFTCPRCKKNTLHISTNPSRPNKWRLSCSNPDCSKRGHIIFEGNIPIQSLFNEAAIAVTAAGLTAFLSHASDHFGALEHADPSGIGDHVGNLDHGSYGDHLDHAGNLTDFF